MILCFRPRSYAAPVSSTEAMNKLTSSLAQLKGSKKAASQVRHHLTQHNVLFMHAIWQAASITINLYCPMTTVS